MQRQSLRDYGPPGTPRDVYNMRKNTADMLRAMGQPVVHLHAWNLDDIARGKARHCPACTSTYNRQVQRRNCEICFGTGFVSRENDPGWYIGSRGERTQTDTGEPAPKYGGFSEPTLTRILRADVPSDIFRINEQGVMVRVETARSTGFWNPKMGDEDMMIFVGLARDEITVNDVGDRYQLRQVTPSTLPGSQPFYGSERDRVGQTFEMALLNRVTNENLYRVPIGGVNYGEL